MNKGEIYDYFDHAISKTCIKQPDDGEWQVVGKWCKVSFSDHNTDHLDLFICNPKDMLNGLGTRKLKNIISGLKGAGKTRFTEVDGEAWGVVAGKQVITDNIKLLGIRWKKTVTTDNSRFLRAA